MKRGSSVIEAMIAIAVLAVMLVTLISVFLYGFGAVARARQTALATQIVQEETEVLRTKAFDQLAGLGATFIHDKLSRLMNGQGLLAVESGPGDDIKKITVGVRWTYRGIVRRKDIVTYVTRQGISKG